MDLSDSGSLGLPPVPGMETQSFVSGLSDSLGSEATPRPFPGYATPRPPPTASARRGPPSFASAPAHAPPTSVSARLSSTNRFAPAAARIAQLRIMDETTGLGLPSMPSRAGDTSSSDLSSHDSDASTSLGQGRSGPRGNATLRSVLVQQGLYAEAGATPWDNNNASANMSKDPVASTPLTQRPLRPRSMVAPPPLPEEPDENSAVPDENATPRPRRLGSLTKAGNSTRSFHRTPLADADGVANASISQQTDITWDRYKEQLAQPIQSTVPEPPVAHAPRLPDQSKASVHPSYPSSASSNASRDQSYGQALSRNRLSSGTSSDRPQSRASSTKTPGPARDSRGNSGQDTSSSQATIKDKLSNSRTRADQSNYSTHSRTPTAEVSRLSARATAAQGLAGAEDQQAELEDLRALIKDQQDELQLLDQERSDLGKLEPQLQAVKAEKAALLVSLEKMIDEQEQAETKDRESQAEIKRLQALVDELQSRAAEHSTSVSSSRSKAALVARADGLEERLHASNAQIEQHRIRLNQLESDLKSAHARVDQERKTRLTAEERASDADSHVRTLQGLLDQAEQEKRSANTQIKRATLDVQAAQKEKAQLQDQVKDLNVLLQSSRKQGILADRSTALINEVLSGNASRASIPVGQDSMMTMDMFEQLHELQKRVDELAEKLRQKVDELHVSRRLETQARNLANQLQAELDVWRTLPRSVQTIRCDDCHGRPLSSSENWTRFVGSLPSELQQRPEWSLEAPSSSDLSISASSVRRNMRKEDIVKAREEAKALSAALNEARQEIASLGAEQRTSLDAQAKLSQGLDKCEAELTRRQKDLEAAWKRIEDSASDKRSAVHDVHKIEQEKLALLQDYDVLWAEQKSTTKHLSEITEKLHGSEAAIARYRHDLCKASEEIEELTATLKERQGSLDQATSDRQSLQRSVERLRLELRAAHVRAEELQSELNALRSERTGAEQLQSQLLELYDLNTELRNQLDTAKASQERSTDLHIKQYKTLLAAMRYKNAQFVREHDLRADLAHQKVYLTRLTDGLRAADQYTAELLDDWYPSRTKRTISETTARCKLRGTFLAVRAMVRMRRMAQHWARTSKMSEALRQAHLAAKANRYAVA